MEDGENFNVNGFVLLGKIFTGNHRDFPMKIMGLKPANFPRENQSIDNDNSWNEWNITGDG